ncbi:MAG: hypothetical protein AAF585_08650 [Verrucomicrobiota bacterium]
MTLFHIIQAVTVALTWPPEPGVVTIESDELLKPHSTLREGVVIAQTAPLVDFVYYDCQTYEPNGVWSCWGDGLAVGDVYYSAIGDHGRLEGNAFLYGYDSKTKNLQLLTDVSSVIKRPAGHYTPGKIHSRIDLGSDGWLYYSTHRGSTKVGLNPDAQYEGDWILRHHPEKAETEVVAHNPLPKQCLPASVLDPDRLIFYAGTADGLNEKPPQFLAYDLKKRRVLFSSPDGPSRAMVFAKSTGKLYFHTSKGGPEQLLRFDPDKPTELTRIDAVAGLRAASEETSKGLVYTVDRDQLWVFDTKTETAREFGPTAVGENDYITSLDLDPVTERYLYYVPGAHGGGQRDGSPLVQLDVKTGARKVICFLHPILHERAGYIPMGAYMVAVSPEGDKAYITWNGNRGATAEDLENQRKVKFNTCALTVVHIPESERQP